MRELLHLLTIEIGAIENQPGGVGYRLTRGQMNESEQNLRAEAVSGIEDLETHCSMPLVSCDCSQGSERSLILPRGLTYGRTYHELEDLILAEARCLHRGKVLVGDLCRPLSDLAHERVERLRGQCVVERGTPLGSGRPTVSLQDPCHNSSKRRTCRLQLVHGAPPRHISRS